MKINLHNGDVLEGEARELAEYVKESNVKQSDKFYETTKEIVELKKRVGRPKGIHTPIKKERGSYRKRIVTAYKLVKAGKSETEALKTVFGYSNKKLKTKLYQHGWYLKNKERLVKKTTVAKTAASSNDKRTARMKYINKRAFELIKSKALNKKDASALASKEYQQLGKVIPKILEDSNMNKILIDVLDNVYKNNGKFIRKRDGYLINITTKSGWEEMMMNIMANHGQIMDYLGVKKPLALKSEDGELVLKVG